MFISDLTINWIIANYISLVIGVIAGIIGNVIYNYVRERQKLRKIKLSVNTGWWEQIIYNPETPYCGEPEKIDYYFIEHSKTLYAGELNINIEGRIRRRYPLSDRRTWKVCGYLADDVFTLLYRADEGQKSRGCIYVKMRHEGYYEGYYLEEHLDEEKGVEIIDKTPLILRKVKDSEMIAGLIQWEKSEKLRESEENKIGKML